MTLTAAERTSFAVQCPRCGKATEKPVAWLAASEALRCATPDCGNILDLQDAQNRPLIQKLIDQATEIDALMISLKQTD
jgi:hypothetical protein